MNHNLSELEAVNEIIAQESVFQNMSHQQLVERCGELLHQANKNYLELIKARDLANKNALEISRLHTLVKNVSYVLNAIDLNLDNSKDFTHAMKRSITELNKKLIDSVRAPIISAIERLESRTPFNTWDDIPF